MNGRQVMDGDYQCLFCSSWNGDHNKACPTSPDEIEVWQAGYAAALEGDDCYAEVGSTFWFGWAVRITRQGVMMVGHQSPGWVEHHRKYLKRRIQ